MTVLNFLYPQNSLDILFFLIMIAWLLFCLFSAWKARQETKNRIHNISHNKISLDIYSLDVAFRPVLWTYIVENAAGFALIIGLLGTFLGIGVAIHGAGQILADLNSQDSSSVKDMRVTMTNLSPILAEIGMKFKVSAWGIITHIILRSSIPFFKVDEIRQEAILAYLEIENNRNKVDKENFQTNFLGLLHKNNEYTEKMLLELKIISHVPSELERSVGLLSEEIVKFGKIVDDFNTSTNIQLSNLNNNVGYLKEDTLDLLKTIKQAVEDTKSEVNTLLIEPTKAVVGAVTMSIQKFSQTNDMAIDLLANIEHSIDYTQINNCINNITTLSVLVQNIEEEIKNNGQNIKLLLSENSGQTTILQAAFGNSGLVQEQINILDGINIELSKALTNQKSSNDKLDNLIQVNSNLGDSIQKNIQVQQRIGQSLVRSNNDKKIRLG